MRNNVAGVLLEYTNLDIIYGILYGNFKKRKNKI